jgi:hypothetical protein
MKPARSALREVYCIDRVCPNISAERVRGSLRGTWNAPLIGIAMNARYAEAIEMTNESKRIKF